MFDSPYFGTLLIIYLFFGGAAAGGLFTMATWSIVFHRSFKDHHPRLQTAFKSLLSNCYVICLVILSFSILCLLLDLGQPERALLLFIKPHFSILTFGSYVLLIELLIVFLLIAANRFTVLNINGTIRKVLEYLCCIVSAAVMIYTGVFLLSITSVPFWNTWALVALFLFSSLSAGISLVLLIDYFVKDQTILLRATRPLQKVHVTLLLFELASLIAFFVFVFLDPDAAKSTTALLAPDMLSIAIIGVIGMGIVVPLILAAFNLKTRPYRTIPVSDVVCLLGGLCLRYVIIQCGIYSM